MRGPAAIVQTFRSWVEAVPPDVEARFEVLAGDDQAIATRLGAYGHAADGGGAMEYVAGAVMTLIDGRTRHVELFDADDDAAAVARYEELRRDEKLPEPTAGPRELLDRYVTAINARDFDALRAVYAPDIRMVDRRLIGWGEREGVDAIIESLSGTIALAEDLHLEAARIAAGAGAGVVRQLWRGHFVEGGGPFEVEMLTVGLVRDGVYAGVEIFEGSEMEAALARFEEIGARTEPERLVARWSRLVNARDWDGIRDYFAEDFEVVDRRALAWEPLRGPEALVELYRTWRRSCLTWRCASRSSWGTSASRDPRGRLRERGRRCGRRPDGGPCHPGFDGSRRPVRAGRAVRSGRRGGRAGALRELRRGPRELVRDYVDALNSLDWDRLAGVFAPELRLVDRRLVGWGELDGRDAFIDVLRGTLALGPDLHVDAELIALGRRAVVGRYINRGHFAEGGGEFEIALLALAVAEDGHVTYFELFESTDTASALARFEEIGAQTEPERVYARIARHAIARDWAALVDCYTEDYTTVERRALGWEPMIGGPAVVDMYRSWVDVVPDVELRFEVFAADDEHLAVRYSGHGHAAAGGGEMEYVTTMAARIRDGRLLLCEMFEADGEAAALARYEELRREHAPTPDRPPTQRELAELYAAAFNSHDWDRLRELYAPDVRLVDRRMIGWGELDGADAVIEPIRGTTALAPDAQVDIDVLVSGERASICRQTVRGHSTEGGGEFEVELFSFGTADDGLITYLEIFDDSGLGAAYDRFEEIGAVTESERFAARYGRAHNAHDLDALRALYTEDCEVVDRRSLGWETLRGIDAVMAMFRSWHETVPDLEDDEVLASDDQHCALRVNGYGHAADGGGALEYFLTTVITIGDDRIRRSELFDASEEEAALARFEELRRAGRPAAAPAKPGEVLERFVAAYNGRDRDALRQIAAPDLRFADRRLVGWGSTRAWTPSSKSSLARSRSLPTFVSRVCHWRRASAPPSCGMYRAATSRPAAASSRWRRSSRACSRTDV